MKRYILIICALASMMLCQGAFGQNLSELADLDSLLNMQGDYKIYKNTNLKIEYDKKLKEKKELFPSIQVSDSGDSLKVVTSGAITFDHMSESYLYVPKRMAIAISSEAKDLELQLDQRGAQGAGFSSCWNLNNSGFGLVVYAAQGNYDRVKFYIKKGSTTTKTFYLCFLDHDKYKYDHCDLLDTTGLGFADDTLRLYRKDTVKTLTAIEPKYSVFRSIELNGKTIHEAEQTDNYNNPENLDRIEVDLASHWDKLQVGENTITVNLATLDEKCKFADVVSKTYVIVVQADDEHNFPWLWVILGGVVVLLMVFAVILGVHGINKKRLLKKLSECKTQICNLQDDASVSSDVKDQLEVFSKRVTAAINNLKGKTLLKKEDKEECETLLNEIDEYANKLGQPQTTPEPQPLSNDELLAKIKKLEDNLSKAGDEKQAALAEQKTKLDQDHEKAVNELRDQLCREHRDEMEAQRKEHENELDRQRKSYEKVVADLRTQYEDRLRTQQQEHEKAISRLHQAYQAQIEAQKTAYEKQISEISAELNSTKNKWNADRKFVIDMYKTSESCLKAMIEDIKVNADVVSPAYGEMMQMHSESVHSFESFHAQFESVMQGELTIAQMREELGRIFTVHIDYERSWINILGRLCAYAQVDKLAPVFGFYNAYKADISSLFVQFELFANLLGFEKIRVPALFAETFDSSTYEPDNTDLVLPAIYPEYVEILVSSMIYDLHTIGYTHEGTTRKPKVAYYV